MPWLRSYSPLGRARGRAFAADAPPAQAEAAPAATDVRVGGDDKMTRFVVDLTQKIDVTAFALANPYRVVVDLPQIAFKLPPKAGEQSRGLVKAFRYGLIMQGGSRIVLDTKGPVRVDKAFVLDATGGQPARLVLDLSRHRPRQLPAHGLAGDARAAQPGRQAKRRRRRNLPAIRGR